MHNIYLILIMYLLFCSCQKKTTDNSVLTPLQDTATANAAICTEQADTNIVLKHDTVYPIRTWSFNYKDGIFPCEYRDGGVVIRGFDTDWNGRFYIAGDYPVRVVCYNGTTLEFDRVISTSKGNSATFKLIGDSIWFLEEESHSVLSMHKSGSGIINHYTLPAIQEEDIIPHRGGKSVSGGNNQHVSQHRGHQGNQQIADGKSELFLRVISMIRTDKQTGGGQSQHDGKSDSHNKGTLSFHIRRTPRNTGAGTGVHVF